jgi:hypothetical protein
MFSSFETGDRQKGKNNDIHSSEASSCQGEEEIHCSRDGLHAMAKGKFSAGNITPVFHPPVY